MVLRKRSVAIELRLRAQAEANREAQQKFKMVVIRFLVGMVAVCGVFLVVATDVLARESVIEEVHSAQLEKLISSRDFVAVFWFSRNCRLCDDALDEIEGIDDDAEKFSVDFVKINDKRLAKTYGIKKFPALSFFQDGEITIFKGDMTDEDEMLDFLTSENLLVIPDKIEDVNSDALATITANEPFVSALFYDASFKSDQIIEELENIDDEADVFKIRFVKIFDTELADEYSLTELPSLVYFRNGIPVVYHGELDDETEVLEWLIQHQSSIDDEDDIENVNDQKLDIMVKNIDHLMVLFHDGKKKSKKALESLENIDDDCDKLGVSFVEVNDERTARSHGVEHMPSLVYYESEIPSVFDGDLTDNDEVMDWMVGLVEGADIEEVKDEMLEKMISREEKIAVLFYDDEETDSKDVLEALEDIDDDLDEKDVRFVKNNEADVAEDYGIEDLPALVVFERGIPNLYEGDLTDEDKVLDWILGEMFEKNTVEVVTNAMLDRLVQDRDHIAVFFYDKKQKESTKVLEILENIDEELEKTPSIHMVKTDDRDAAEEYGIKSIPALVLFEDGVPNLYQGDLRDSYEILDWITFLSREANIEEVNTKMLEKMISAGDMVVVFIYSKSSHDANILKDLENIDDDLEDMDVRLVKLPDDGRFGDKHGIDVIPALVLFRDGEAMVYKGDIGSEDKAVEWISEQLEDD